MLGDPLRLLGHQVNGVGVVPVHARQDGPIKTTNKKKKMAGVVRLQVRQCVEFQTLDTHLVPNEFILLLMLSAAPSMLC